MNLSLSAVRSSNRELNSPPDEGRALPIGPVGAPVARDLRNICFGNRARAPSFNSPLSFSLSLSLSLSVSVSVSPLSQTGPQGFKHRYRRVMPARRARDYLSRRTGFHKVPDMFKLKFHSRMPRCFNPRTIVHVFQQNEILTQKPAGQWSLNSMPENRAGHRRSVTAISHKPQN